MTDVLTHTPETQKPNSSRLQRFLARVGFGRSKQTQAPSEGPSPFSPEGMPSDERAALQASQAALKENVTQGVANTVTSLYQNPDSSYNQAMERRDFEGAKLAVDKRLDGEPYITSKQDVLDELHGRAIESAKSQGVNLNLPESDSKADTESSDHGGGSEK